MEQNNKAGANSPGYRDRKMGNIGTASESNPVTAHGIFNSNGYTAKITSKSGGSTMNAVVIKGNAYSPKEVAKISEVGVNANIDKPKYNYAKVTFTVTLQWQSGQTAYNNGTIARK